MSDIKPSGQPDAGGQQPVLVATNVDYCIFHRATDHGDKKWEACRFRQLFYFENPMDEHTVEWADDISGLREAPPAARGES